jgi:hypothetical protein
MLNRYASGSRVSDSDAAILAAALARHPDAAEKIGQGIAHFEVKTADYGTRCFWVCRTDGSKEKFSYFSCL